MDICNVLRIVNYLVPSSESVYIQRIGHGGRNGEPAVAILLIEPSVYQLQKASGTCGDDDDAEGNTDNVVADDNSIISLH